MLDLERNGQGAMLTCSGAYKDGSLRVVRNGIGVREEAAIELPGIQGVWSLKDPAAADTGADAFDKLLVQTFATETRVLALEADEEEGSDALQLAECEIPGFDAAQRTLLCANLSGGLLLQVTPASCRLVDGQSMQLVDEWRLPADAVAAAGAAAKITVAAANSGQVLLAAGRVLLLLTLNARKLQLHHHITMDQEISCVDITPVSAVEEVGHSKAAHLRMGKWSTSFCCALLIFSSPPAVRASVGWCCECLRCCRVHVARPHCACVAHLESRGDGARTTGRHGGAIRAVRAVRRR